MKLVMLIMITSNSVSMRVFPVISLSASSCCSRWMNPAIDRVVSPSVSPSRTALKMKRYWSYTHTTDCMILYAYQKALIEFKPQPMNMF